MYRKNGGEKEREVMRYVKRDKDTDEIIGIDPKAPASVKATYNSMKKQANSKKPVKK